MKWSCHVWCNEITMSPRLDSATIYKHRFMRHIIKRHQINIELFFQWKCSWLIGWLIGVNVSLSFPHNRSFFFRIFSQPISGVLLCTCVSGLCRGILFYTKLFVYLFISVSFTVSISFRINSLVGSKCNERLEKNEKKNLRLQTTTTPTETSTKSALTIKKTENKRN